MRYTTFGRSGLRVSELFLGTLTFGQAALASEVECRRILDCYAEAGGNTVDTAVNYRDGASELILGQLLSGQRDRFVVSTKYTLSRNLADPNAAGNARKNLRASLDTSLRRLRTDYVDLYWIHVWDHSTPVEETMRALDDEVRAGRILYVGISDAPAWVVARGQTLAELRGWSPFAGLQVPYSLLQRDAERELLPMARALGLGVAGWSPLAGGLLTGSLGSRHSGRTLSPHETAVLDAVRAAADELGVTPAQVAIAWARRAGHPILGASRAEQLSDNLGALTLELPPAAEASLDAATGFSAGFPSDFLGSVVPSVFGAAYVA